MQGSTAPRFVDMYAPQHPGPNMVHQQQAQSSMCGQNGPLPSMNANGMAYGLPHTPLAPHHVNHASMTALSQAFGGMAVQDGGPLRTSDMALPGLTVTAPQLGLIPAHGNLHHHHQQQAVLLMHNGVVYAPTTVGSYPCLPGQGSAPPGPAIHALPDRHYPRTAPFERQMAFGRDYNMMPVTPTPRVFGGTHPEPAGEHPPGLDDRQVSIGSHSDGDQVPSPDTPDAIDANRLGQNVVIARADVSPMVQYGYGTTSPPHFVQTFDAAHMAKAMAMHPVPHDVMAVAAMAPAIPRAVPAVSSCRKTLQHCFENPSGTTNVYIRGLHPNTTDDMLLAYSARFGHVANSKAMIDNQTGACKGYEN
ncbi:MAG: hypothetical protein M1823_005099 [Watsoniomyces obsoletus]|nr:MAG: hypothetical protein M1823_005099 [Watsoniomyces obsoletus]